MTEETETTESLRRGLYRELIDAVERLEILARWNFETGHTNEAIDAALIAFQLREFAQRFKE